MQHRAETGNNLRQVSRQIAEHLTLAASSFGVLVDDPNRLQKRIRHRRAGGKIGVGLFTEIAPVDKRI
jgi:hypothetical protein